MKSTIFLLALASSLPYILACTEGQKSCGGDWYVNECVDGVVKHSKNCAKGIYITKVDRWRDRVSELTGCLGTYCTVESGDYICKQKRRRRDEVRAAMWEEE
jgi:hypothetical protein